MEADPLAKQPVRAEWFGCKCGFPCAGFAGRQVCGQKEMRQIVPVCNNLLTACQHW
ncbi:MAG: hypothetical protein SPL42_08770 [Bacteroidales bacterium]|nr:hypothetical protein [Bacteroidales bacterium]